MGLFKKRLSVIEATGEYIKRLAQSFENWDSDKQYLNGIADQFGLPEIDHSSEFSDFEFMLALMSLELLVVKNLFSDYYDEITDSLLNMLAFMDDVGEYAVTTVRDEYMPEIEAVVKENLFPYEGITSILLEKLEIEYNMFLATAIVEVIGKRLGTWKKLFNDYKITPR